MQPFLKHNIQWLPPRDTNIDRMKFPIALPRFQIGALADEASRAFDITLSPLICAPEGLSQIPQFRADIHPPDRPSNHRVRIPAFSQN